jgi:exodeoxyribonuclease V alpha subunit
LLYTGLTRARELAVVVGQPRALAIAVRNDRVARRYSLLADRLMAAHARRQG